MGYMTEEIGEDYKSWGKNFGSKYIFLNGGTGTGKTHFVTHTLLEYSKEQNKKILYLCNRKALKNQVEAEIQGLDEGKSHITVALYQGFIRWIKRKNFICENYSKEIFDGFMNSIQSEDNSFDVAIPAWPAEYPAIDKYGNRYNVFHNMNFSAYNTIGVENVNLYDQNRPDPLLFLNATDSYGNYHFTYTFNEHSEFAKLKRNKMLQSFENYDYIVMDEIHYLLQDATFNFDTYDLFEEMMKPEKQNQTLIFMSGTPDEVHEVLMQCVNKTGLFYDPSIITKTYCVKPDYSRIKPQVFTAESQLIKKLSENINDKWLIFVESKERGKRLKILIDEMYRLLSPQKKCAFFCRMAWIDSKLEKIGQSSLFNEYDCIVSTSILDNGVTLDHKNFKHLAIIAWDDVEFLQMIGRKRFKGNEELNLYIMERTKDDCRKHYNRIVERLNILNEFMRLADDKNPYSKFRLISKYCNDERMFAKLKGIVKFTHNGFKCNGLAYYKYQFSQKTFFDICNGEYSSLAEHQLSLINAENFRQTYIKNDPYLESIRKLLTEKAYSGYMNLEELREFRIELSKLIKGINNKSDFAIKSFGKNGCKAAFLNRWLIGADIFFEIASIQDKGKRDKNLYYIREIPEDNIAEARNKAKSEYIQLYGIPQEESSIKAEIVRVPRD